MNSFLMKLRGLVKLLTGREFFLNIKKECLFNKLLKFAKNFNLISDLIYERNNIRFKVFLKTNKRPSINLVVVNNLKTHNF